MDAARCTTEVGSPGVVLLPQEELESSWTWRRSWYSGSDSIYALLAKFAELNAIGQATLCELFVEKHESGVRAHLRSRPYYPRVDLRSSEHFRLGRLAAILHLDAAQVRQAFVGDQFPNARFGVNANLVWCRFCAQRGYHATSFQLNHATMCPAHRVPLLKACTRCRQPLPYVLHSTKRAPFFACAHCGADHARLLRGAQLELSLLPAAGALFRDHLEMVRLVDSLPTLIDAHRRASGDPSLPVLVGKPDAYRHRAAFEQFVADVLHAVVARKGSQRELAVIAPSATYVEPYLPVRKILQQKPPEARRGDPELLRAWSVYRSVRRWIWRRVVHSHGRCIETALNQLWWDLEGSTTASFCPVALAFVRWRMQWEGCRVPGHLNRRRLAPTPYGLAAWVSSEAPIGSPLWTLGFERWLNAHLVGEACLASFRGWLESSQRWSKKGQVYWRAHEADAFCIRHWAAVGRGTLDEPGVLYAEELAGSGVFELHAASRAHRHEHLASLITIVR